MLFFAAHNPKVAGSNPAPATKTSRGYGENRSPFFLFDLYLSQYLSRKGMTVGDILNLIAGPILPWEFRAVQRGR